MRKIGDVRLELVMGFIVMRKRTLMATKLFYRSLSEVKK